MEESVTLRINGREVKAQAGMTILQAARDANIFIPTLCNNEELTPYGACRLCIVEISLKKRTRLVASCIYEVVEGLEVDTESKKVVNVRKLVMELLLTRNTRHPVLLELAASLGVEKSRFVVEKKGCILCGMCIRTCKEVVGVSAIGYKERGRTRKVATPFDETPEDCIACGSCAYVCPVDFIPMTEKGGVRTIWKTEFPMRKCAKCGRHFAPEKQLEYFTETMNLADDHFANCLNCR